MTLIEKATIQHYHKHRFEQFHYSNAQKQGWTSLEVQQLRFETILSLADFNNASVLDVGCGYGDFKAFLDQYIRRFDYIGVDQQPEFIKEAEKKYSGQPGIWFYETDAASCKLPEMDVVVASGLLSYQSKDSNYYQKMIARLYAIATHGFIFNMLDDQVFESSDLIVSHNKKKVLEYCETLSNEVIIKEDYLPIDFTICMKKTT